MTRAILAAAVFLLLSSACGVKGPPVRSVDAAPSEVETESEPAQEEEESES